MVAEMLKNKEKVFRRLCKEPVLYFEAYKLLGKEKEAEDVCSAALEVMIEIYPVLQGKRYQDLLRICRIIIQYRCVASLGLVSEIDEEIMKNAPAANQEYFHTLVHDCGSDALLQVLKELRLDKRCILMLRYAFGLDTDSIKSLLGLSQGQALKEVEISEMIMAAGVFPQSVSTVCCDKTRACLSCRTGN